MITADTSRPSSPNAPKPRPTPPPPAPVPGRARTMPDPTPMPTPTAPQPPRPTPGRVDVYATEYRCNAVATWFDGHQSLVGTAVRNMFGWHVVVPAPKGQPKQWRSVATAYDAAQVLYALALAGAR